MDKKVINRINDEINKIDKNENTIFFFVIDTKGNPSGILDYIYKIAKIIKDNGYNVNMLYQMENKDDEFIGVKDWLGEEYASIEHHNIAMEEVNVAPSDILFIPEVFSNIMIQTKKLPCKRIAILQNFNYLLEQMPISAQWGDLGIMECITNSNTNKNLLHEIFPYVKTTLIPPYIDKIFGNTTEPKKLIINIMAKNQSDINKIVKPFYWKYPIYKWVTFRDLRGYDKTTYSKMLREAAMTIWVDEDTSFGYGALEALKSGSILIAKVTSVTHDWMIKDDKLRDCCIWFDNFYELHKMIASVVRAWTNDSVPSIFEDDAKEVIGKYNFDETNKTLLEYIQGVMTNRKKELESLITQLKIEK